MYCGEGDDRVIYMQQAAGKKTEKHNFINYMKKKYIFNQIFAFKNKTKQPVP